ncbi:MAG: hypothetical protein IKN46_00635, partial [Acholeplasmatales bacterium]|nr:hypothetical protein [Acholeplasmatales bacterium]
NDLTQDYVYKYEAIDPTTGYIWSSNTNSQPAGYTKIFDTTWIEAPGLQTSDYEKRNTSTTAGYQNDGRYSTKLFYFEIPVNKGEFALGSVNGRDGGYLLYLDIGANAAAVDRTTITQESKTVVSDYKYVNGIQILADTGNITSISAANSAVAVIKTTSNVSEVSISRTGDTISFGTLNNNVLTPFSNNLDVSYKSEDISLSGAELKALDEDESTKKVLKYLDYNRATESLYQTIINNDGTNNTDYEVYRLNPTTMEKTGDILDYNGMNIDDRMNATYGLLMIDTTSSSVPAGKRVDNFTSIAITTSTNPAVLKYDLYTDTTNKNNVVETIDMVVTRVTGNQTVYNLDNNINDITVTNGRLTLSDNYLAEFLYRLQGNTITITSVEETTVTVKEINRANNTYTFIFKTYDGTTYEVTAVGNTVTIPVSQ